MDKHRSLPSTRWIILRGVLYTSQEALAMATLTVHLKLVFPSLFHSSHHTPHFCFLGLILNKLPASKSLFWAIVFWGSHTKAESFVGENV